MQFIKFLKDHHFKPPQIIHNQGQRAASPLELFIDLAYVGMIAAVVHYIVGAAHIGPLEMWGFTLRFLSMFTIWNGMVWYNNLFEDQSWRHRLLMLGLVFAVLVMQTSLNADNAKAMWFLVGGYSGSRFLQAMIWWLAIKQPTTPKEVQKATQPFIYGSILAATLALIVTMLTQNPLIILITWTITLILEYFAPMLLFRHVIQQEMIAGNPLAIPPVSHHLYMERFALFFILILGEGTISVAKILSNYTDSMGGALLFGALTLWIIFAMMQMYFLVVQSVSYSEQYIQSWTWLHIPIFMSASLVAGLIPELYHPHHLENIPQIKVLFIIAFSAFMFFMSIAHIYRKNEAEALMKHGYSVEAVRFGRKVISGLSMAFLAFLLLPISATGLIAAAALWPLLMILRVEYTKFKSAQTLEVHQQSDP